jgi:hypothetical protein
MVPTDHPGCRGVATRLPKKPGIQKLTPPSSATALLFENVEAMISSNANASLRLLIASERHIGIRGLALPFIAALTLAE